MNTNYDLIVIGAGLFGSSSAYHASKIKGIKIAHIGPSEPTNKDETQIHGAWYDEGRIYTSASRSCVWSELAARSSRRFKELEEESGIEFFAQVGCCTFSPDKEMTEQVISNSEQAGSPMMDITNDFEEYLPFLNFPEDANIVYDTKTSGYISPRSLVKAYRKVAKRNGVNQIDDLALKILKNKETTDWNWEITTKKNGAFRCKHVLVTVGAYAQFNELFPDVKPGFVPKLELRTQTVVFLEIDEKKWDKTKNVSLIGGLTFEGLDGFYLLPPIEYPDGKYYLKIGHGRNYERVLTTLEEMAAFYQNASHHPDCLKDLEALARYLIPGLPVLSAHGGGGITAHTPTALPYIDQIKEGFTICLGGNGYGAKSSLEIGRLATNLAVHGKWDDKFERDKLKTQWSSR